MPLLILNLSCENVKYPARKHFEKTNITYRRTAAHNVNIVNISIIQNNFINFINTCGINGYCEYYQACLVRILRVFCT